MSKSFSQLGQDLKVLEQLENKQNGYFVEIGASDGILLSNTFLLEKNYQWKGICVEPLPSKFKKLQQNRKCHCANYAVYKKSNEIVNFDISNDDDMLSGISTDIDKYFTKVKNNKTTIQVDTISFTDLLKNYDAPKHMDYLSLDTEGSEFHILQSLDFEIYSFSIIDIEHNYVENKRKQIRDLLSSKGYIYDGENQFDDHYIHPCIN